MYSYLKEISQGKTLTIDQAKAAMACICTSTNNENLLHLAAFLAVLHTRGETQEELLGFIAYLRSQTNQIDMGDQLVIDICGTGGDYSNTFNISTASALLVASTGIKVAKHGGRSVSSRCGSADVLEELGISIQKDAESVRSIINNLGFSFLFAPYFNAAFQNVLSLRKKLGIRTSFNLLGPLLHPMQIKHQVIGVYNNHLLRPVAKIMQQLGSEEVMVVHSQDGLDEFSISAPTWVAHLKSGRITYYIVNAEEFGLRSSSIKDLKGGDAKTNAFIIEQIFSGEKSIYRDSVLLNSAAGFVIAGKAQSLSDGIILANEAIDSGKAIRFLHQLQRHYQEINHD